MQEVKKKCSKKTSLRPLLSITISSSIVTDMQSSANCHAETHEILGGLNLRKGSLRTCPRLIAMLDVTRLTLADCLPGAYLGQRNSHATQSTNSI